MANSFWPPCCLIWSLKYSRGNTILVVLIFFHWFLNIFYCFDKTEKAMIIGTRLIGTHVKTLFRLSLNWRMCLFFSAPSADAIEYGSLGWAFSFLRSNLGIPGSTLYSPACHVLHQQVLKQSISQNCEAKLEESCYTGGTLWGCSSAA